jgi:hypothetical protein
MKKLLIKLIIPVLEVIGATALFIMLIAVCAVETLNEELEK